MNIYYKQNDYHIYHLISVTADKLSLSTLFCPLKMMLCL